MKKKDHIEACRLLIQDYTDVLGEIVTYAKTSGDEKLQCFIRSVGSRNAKLAEIALETATPDKAGADAVNLIKNTLSGNEFFLNKCGCGDTQSDGSSECKSGLEALFNEIDELITKEEAKRESEENETLASKIEESGDLAKSIAEAIRLNIDPDTIDISDKPSGSELKKRIDDLIAKSKS